MSKYDTAWVNDETGEVHSPKGRLIWANLFEAKVNRQYPETPAKFSIGALLLPAAANIDAIKEEVARAGTEAIGKDWHKVPNICLKKTVDNLKLAEFVEAFPFYLSASANADFPPFVYGPNAKLIERDDNGAYNGRWAVIAGKAWASKKGKGNVGWNLNRVQLLDHDEVIAGGRVATASGFEAVADKAPAAGAAAPAGQKASSDALWS